MSTLEVQLIKHGQVSRLINATISIILNTCFENAENNIERQAIIEVAQDYGQYDLSDVLIERYELINK